jgi:hypothetical protein
MDWDAAIEKHREALKRVLAGLLVMAGFVGGSPATLPRHLHRAVLNLLRPAEAAVRRLVIVAARGIVVEVRHPGPRASPLTRKPPPLTPPHHKGEGDSGSSMHGRNVVVNGGTLRSSSPLWGSEGRARQAARPEKGGGMPRSTVPDRRYKPAAIGFPLFDPPSRWGRIRRRPARICVPRIAFPGVTALSPIRLPPMPMDPIDTTPLARRLAALGRALDDLPRQALRFARWQARKTRSASLQQLPGAGARIRRVWPLRPGRPARGCRPAHAVHAVLTDIHGLALWALEPADTS